MGVSGKDNPKDPVAASEAEASGEVLRAGPL